MHPAGVGGPCPHQATLSPTACEWEAWVVGHQQGGLPGAKENLSSAPGRTTHPT